MKIAIGCDHGGLDTKNAVIEYLESKNIPYINVGTNTAESVDYPVFAKKAAELVAKGECKYGVLCCTTGIGMSIVANKQKGVRAALVGDEFSAMMTRKHNDSNIICFGSRIVSGDQAKILTEIFINTEFEGGRHSRRVDMFEN